MMILLTYDVNIKNESGATRLRKVAKICENYGMRVQNSVFEMLIDPTQLVQIKAKLEKVIDKEYDSIRFYRLGKNWKTKVESMGRDTVIHQDDTLML